MMSKTVTELAKELNVSRQAVQQAIDKLVTSKQPKKINNRYAINADTERLIKQSITKNNDKQVDKQVDKQLPLLVKEKDKQIVLLKKQNEQLEKQLEQQNKQIEQLHVLMLNTQKENEQLLLSNENDAKKSWFSIFKK
jgi:DNA-binding Lrp family transcriptional regulator